MLDETIFVSNMGMGINPILHSVTLKLQTVYLSSKK